MCDRKRAVEGDGPEDAEQQADALPALDFGGALGTCSGRCSSCTRKTGFDNTPKAPSDPFKFPTLEPGSLF